MQTMISLANTGCGLHRPHLDLHDHPVFQALPDRFQSAALARRNLTRLPAGQPLEEDGFLSFVLAGVLGLFPNGDGICVATIVAGSVHGWDQALEPDGDRPLARALIDTTLCRVPADCVVENLGRDWLTRLVARQSSGRLSGLAAEAACNASHLVQQRLAKWLVRLHCGANGAPLRLTQADFGAMLGVQRTSVNAAAGRLQAQGLVRFGRGKVQILNLAGLRAASCGCGDQGASAPVATTASLRPAESPSWIARDAPLQDTAA
ncbi:MULTISPECIES: Crp/Fnr family transcriptional regulator [unclassified Brevundimonas]|uniref:Crp/Fnr family transcriptional regulator n=1 Tax=unclassified Brevundimonas TaxID=2622653 RepID=UPI0025BCBE09|nr:MULTISPECIES: Crp/Fnr family transcriptional regulator [unclassified Brevundimonas]